MVILYISSTSYILSAGGAYPCNLISFLPFSKVGLQMGAKDQGGLGIIDFQVLNKCLLRKWMINLLNGEETWQNLLRKANI